MVYIFIFIFKLSFITIWGAIFIKKYKELGEIAPRHEILNTLGLEIGLKFFILENFFAFFFPMFIISVDLSDPEFIEVWNMEGIVAVILWGIGPFIPVLLGLSFSLRS